MTTRRKKKPAAASHATLVEHRGAAASPGAPRTAEPQPTPPPSSPSVPSALGLRSAPARTWIDTVFRVLFYTVLVVGAFVRINLIGRMGPADQISPQDETNYYYAPARNLFEGRDFTQNNFESWTPLQGMFEYCVFRVADNVDFQTIRVIQCFISIAGILVAFLVGRQMHDRWCGLIAMAFIAYHHVLAMQAAYLLTENNYIFLFFGFLAVFGHALSRPAPLRLAAAGAMLGLVCLQRPNPLLFLGVALPWIVLTPRWRSFPWKVHALRYAAFAAAFAVVMSPWVVRNYRVYDAFVPGITVVGRVILRDNSPTLDNARTPFYDDYPAEDAKARLSPGREKVFRALPLEQGYRNIIVYDRLHTAEFLDHLKANPARLARNYAIRFFQQFYYPHRPMLESWRAYNHDLFFPVLDYYGWMLALGLPGMALAGFARRRGIATFVAAAIVYFAVFGAFFHITRDGRMNILLRTLMAFPAALAVRLVFSGLEWLALRMAPGAGRGAGSGGITRRVRSTAGRGAEG